MSDLELDEEEQTDPPSPCQPQTDSQNCTEVQTKVSLSFNKNGNGELLYPLWWRLIPCYCIVGKVIFSYICDGLALVVTGAQVSFQPLLSQRKRDPCRRFARADHNGNLSMGEIGYWQGTWILGKPFGIIGTQKIYLGQMSLKASQSILNVVYSHSGILTKHIW